MLGHSRSGRFQALLAPLTIVGLLALAAPASAEVLATERVAKDQVALIVGSDGVVHAKETISYDFNGGRGLERSFVTKIRDNDTRDRIFKIEGVKASSPDGGPTDASVTINGDRTIVKVSGSHAVSGRHTVALEYDVRGAVATLGNAEELRWSAVGGWRVPVLQAKVSVDSGAAIRNINCFAGSLESSTGCTQFFLSNHTQTRAEFSQQNLLPDEYLTVVVGYPLGMTKAQPLYEMRRTLATAFTVNTVTGGSLLGLLVLLLGGFGLLYQLRGRDARTVSKKAAEGDQAPVDSNGFAPPDGVRPGQIGTLIDEQADVIDVTATIVDLAVRGYLLIEEEDRATTGRLDWKLVKQERPQADLLPYEQLLFDALFDQRAQIRLSELGGTFAGDLAKVRQAMYADMVTQGWFTRRPDAVRTRWTVAGFVLTGLGVVGTIALALFTNLALIGLAIIIGGAALAMGGQYMPAKTSRGATVLAHTIGFRAHLLRGESSPELADTQRIALFSRYLPYAVVFDAIGHWAKSVEDAGVREEGADNLYWYEGPAEWDLSKFAESMRTFTLATSGAISQSRQFRSLS